ISSVRTLWALIPTPFLVLLFMVLVGILRGNPEGRWGCLWPCPGCNAKVGTVDASASTVPLRLASPETTGSERSHGSTQANTQAEGHFLRQHQITKNPYSETVQNSSVRCFFILQNYFARLTSIR